MAKKIKKNKLPFNTNKPWSPGKIAFYFWDFFYYSLGVQVVTIMEVDQDQKNLQ